LNKIKNQKTREERSLEAQLDHFVQIGCDFQNTEEAKNRLINKLEIKLRFLKSIRNK